MADIIKDFEILDYKQDIILRRSLEKPHKILLYKVDVMAGPNSQLVIKGSLRVIDAIGKIRYSGDHLSLAIQTYNKLYNGEG